MMTCIGIKGALPRTLLSNNGRYALPYSRLSHSVLSRTVIAAVATTMVVIEPQFQVLRKCLDNTPGIKPVNAEVKVNPGK